MCGTELSYEFVSQSKAVNNLNYLYSRMDARMLGEGW